MKTVNLFTKEEIEEGGFVYEPDVDKCLKMLTPFVYSSVDVEGENIKLSFKIKTDEEEPTERQWKNYVSSCIKCKYVHSIFISLDEPIFLKREQYRCDNVRVCVMGHTKFTPLEMEERSEHYSQLFDLS